MRPSSLLALAALSISAVTHAQYGLLDPSFSTDGMVIYDAEGNEENGVDIAVRSDGKLWVLGNSYSTQEKILLMRFNTDGTLDNTFFGDGVQELSQGVGNTFSSCMELQADGSLFIGGYYIDELGSTSPLVIKVDANGNPVPGFGSNGFALGYNDGYRVTDLGVQSSGTIVVTLGPLSEINPAVCAVSSTGVFAETLVQLQCSLFDRLTAMQVQSDDRVLVTGYRGTDNGSNWVGSAAQRFETAGSSVSTIFEREKAVADQLQATATTLQSAALAVKQGYDLYDNTRKTVDNHVNTLTALIENAKRETGLTTKIIDDLERIVGQLRVAETQSQQYLEKVNGALKKAFTDFGAQMSHQVAYTIKQTDTHLSRGMNHLRGVVGELAVALSKLLRAR